MSPNCGLISTAPSIGAMERFILEHGTFTIKPVILYYKDEYFVVRFANEEERDMVLCSGPHYLIRRPIIMKPWVPEFNFKEEILITIPLWVKFPNLPLNCWNAVVLSKIESSLGKSLYADECTSQVNRISFARILVEMDITRPLRKMIKMYDPKGKVLEQQVWYLEFEANHGLYLARRNKAVKKPDAQIQKKGLNQGKKKEWVPVTDRGKEQNNDIGQDTVQMQEVMEHQQRDEVQERGGGKAHNQITILTKQDITIIRRMNEIKQKVVGFYQKLLGKNTRHMPAAQPEVFKVRSRLNKMQQLKLIQTFTEDDVKAALGTLKH
ncbi:uncharacterized protein [Solanum tuberosum]|uniref:uncharacterized protein n=1 Tax=Solanum tuberosum TaxID=4113 RepID=UPI00073A0B23|nr:PREDICTED: uncharacterized protein LOC107060555 [Solanum tuberosum]